MSRKSLPKFQDSLNGKLLLASPGMGNAIFNRSVILILHHSADEGAYGLILNRPVEKTVGELLHGEPFETLSHLPVFYGGPVALENLTFSALWWTPSGKLQFRALLSVEQAGELNHQPGALIRSFIGYSGWTKGQLEGEIEDQVWMVTSAPSELLGMMHDRQLWSDVLRAMGPFYQILAEFPEDPTLN